MKNKIIFSFFRYFVPMTKRIFSLLFKKKNYPILNILNKSKKKKNFQSFLLIELELINVLFLKINNNTFPIFHDNASLTITLPLEENVNEIEIYALGLFKSKKQKITPLSSSNLSVKSIVFNRLGQIADKKLAPILPEIFDIKTPLDISYSSVPILSESVKLKEKIYTINYKQKVNVNLDLTDLESKLKNQIIHE